MYDTNRRRRILRRNTRSRRVASANFKLTPAPSYDPVATPSKVHSCAEHGTATEPPYGRDPARRVEDRRFPSAPLALCFVLGHHREFQAPTSTDAQPQKIYTTRQILHPVRELHGRREEWPGNSAISQTLGYSDDFYHWWEFRSRELFERGGIEIESRSTTCSGKSSVFRGGHAEAPSTITDRDTPSSVKLVAL